MIHDFDLIFNKNNVIVFPTVEPDCLYQLLFKQNEEEFLQEDDAQHIDYDLIILLSFCTLSQFIKIVQHFNQHDTAYFFRLIMKANSISYKDGDIYDCSQVFLNRLGLFQEYNKLDLLFKPLKIPFIKSLIKDSNYNYQYLLSISFEKWLKLFSSNSIFYSLISSIKEKHYLEQNLLVLNDKEIKITKI